MAFIYKVTNNINQKVYIGKTDRDVETRWKEHKRHAKALSHIVFYKALLKYGFDNFTIETIEECDISVLNAREEYWINFFDSFFSGYNGTLGGEGSKLQIPEEEIEEIKIRYQEGERLDLLCKEFHHDYSKIREELIKRGVVINTNAGPKKLSKAIFAIDPVSLQIIAEYESISAAGRSLCEEGKNPRAIANHISRYKNTKTVSHGFLWKTLDQIESIKREVE